MTKAPALIALIASIFAGPGFGAQIPRESPEFVFKMVGAPQQLLSMYKGKTIVLAFMYTTCRHCQETAQVLTQVQKDYEARGIQVLGAVFDPGAASRAIEFHRQLGLNFPVGYSEARPVLEFLQQPLTDRFFVPILVFIDKHGMIRSQFMGEEANIRAEVDKLLVRETAPMPKS